MARPKHGEWTTKKGLEKLEEWARQGLIDEQIAHNMGIAPSTLYEYKNKFIEISEAIKRGKAVIDLEVENALKKEALNGNVTAQIFWLKNRQPERWRDKVQSEVMGKDGEPIKTETTFRWEDG